ncbi:MAG TPA: hypothetical protein VJQ83_04525 [Tepidiformaceae bacterium]|nr:hypothetical protein [Tepidiformaceae bacterium]
MRVLAIGYALPDPEIDNYNPLTAPSYHDYDALIIDPAGVTRAVHEVLADAKEYEAHDGRPVLNVPSTATSVSIADQLRRRLDETRSLLESGGTVIVFGRPNAQETGVSGFEGCDRYSWLPAPGGLSWNPPYLRAAEGKTTRIAAESHPTAGLLREFRGEIGYRATFDLRQSEVRTNGRILATGGAGVPTAMEFPLFGGRIVFVPAFSDNVGAGRSQLATALVDVCRRLSGATPAEEAPHWTRSIALPGLEQAEAEREEAAHASEQASARLGATREAEEQIARHRELLWEDGVPFQRAVATALRLLGFAVEGGGEAPLVAKSEGAEAFVEVESSRDQVVEWPYVRLQRRLEERLLATSEQPRGLVIVNGERTKSPDTRGERFTPALRIACENYRYALVTSETIFALVQRALGGATETELTAMRRRLLRTTGLIELPQALGETEERTDSGPIF